MMRDMRAEVMVQVRRPANWLLLGIAVALTTTFAYVVPYAGYRSESDATPGTRVLADLLPEAFHGSALDGLPVFVGALALIFGVLVTGSEYTWQTWKTLLVQQPSRMAVFAGKVCTLALGALVLLVALLAVTAGASFAVATIEDATWTWPAVRDVLAALAGGWLIAFMWAMLGMALAIVMRGVALPVGIGLVWMLAVQNLITALAAPLLDWVDAAQEWLPGPAAGSLVATLGGREGTPGVAELSSQGQSIAVVVGYLALFSIVAGAFLWRRDLT